MVPVVFGQGSLQIPQTYGSYGSRTLTQTQLYPDQRLDTETEMKIEHNGKGASSTIPYGRI
jgi:hypothetical protein